ncbi:MAG: N-acetylmuramoyl-L-alanine amidase [Chloroflexota bacterium]|nr:N-acetylmuramoyl-L-alanine amidase [Chloroflexota bacterium]
MALLLPAGPAEAASPSAVAATPVQPYVVAVVPGHGGEDPGAVFPQDSSNPQVEEKNLTLPIALKLRDRLLAEDVHVVMTRTGDTTTTAQQRAGIAERAHANIFVAVHINSFYSDPTVRGAEAQYFSDPHLADSVGDGLVLALHPFEEPVRTSKDRERDNILSMPGVIIEAGYLSNEQDRQLLQRDDYQSAIAQGIYDGVLKYAPEIEQLKPAIEAQKVAEAAARQKAKAARFPVVPAAIAGVVVLGAAYVRARRRARRRTSRAYSPTARYRYR